MNVPADALAKRTSTATYRRPDSAMALTGPATRPTTDDTRRSSNGHRPRTHRNGPYSFVSAPSATAWPVVGPVIAVILLSLLIRAYDLDLGISRLSYDVDRQFFPFARAEPWLAFYRYGIYVPMVLGVVALIAAIFGRWIVPVTSAQRSRFVRRDGLFIVLMLLIGPGLLVNSGLKALWGRPRPWQCDQFGGPMSFKPLGEISSQKFANSSFPSGHAAAGFFLMAPAFVAGSQRLRRQWLIMGSAYGSAMGVTRVLQGGHFISDVIWAAAIVYLIGVSLARMMYRDHYDDLPEPALEHDEIAVSPTSCSSMG